MTFRVVSAGTDATAADGVAVSEENDRGLCLHVQFGQFDMPPSQVTRVAER